MSPRIIVLSDLHIAPPGPLASFHAGPKLAQFLADQARAETTLVLDGDIFDFLQIDRPPKLDMSGAPALFQRMLDDIAKTDWGRDILKGLGDLLRKSGRCVVLPGNHDPELAHPGCRAVLLGALGLGDDAALSFYTADSPWVTMLGGLEVVIGHGHRRDGFNDIDPAAIRRAIETGARDVALPPGSRLVTEVINDFKLAVDAHTGAPRFPFIDLLKPEMPAVALLLLYLDPKMAMLRLGKAFGLSVRMLLRSIERRLRPGPVLGPQSSEPEPITMAEALAEALVAELPERNPAAATTQLRVIQLWLEGHGAPAEGTLAAHGGKLRAAIRAKLHRMSSDGSFFDEGHLSKYDQALVNDYLPEGRDPRVAIFGHTHAARHRKLDASRTYINTGTWMDLMKLPPLDDNAAAEAWIDALDEGRVPRLQRLTYAEVTPEGVALRTYPAEAGDPMLAPEVGACLLQGQPE